MKYLISKVAVVGLLGMLGAQAQAAVTVNCPGTAVTTDREFSLTTADAYPSSCLAFGVGNINGASGDPFLAANPLYSLLDKDQNADDGLGLVELAFSVTGLGGTSGTFSLQAALWNTYSSLAFALKSGEGQADPDWAVFSLKEGTTSGDWQISSPGPGQQSLSHANLYGILKTPGNDVPEPGSVALIAAAMLAVGATARRRRNAR